jgi:peptidoglycan-associated lipoprotein
MKRLTLSSLLALLLAGLLAGCASTETAKDQPGATVEDRTAPGTPTTAGADGQTRPLTSPDGRSAELTDPKNILSKRSVFFDYDKDDIKPEFKPLIEAHAKYLREHKPAKVFLQGNADDRGSREYNLALGQRRADAVRKMMGVLGVPEAQLESVSFGEEKPRATCADESCWSQNRRTDIVYQGE